MRKGSNTENKTKSSIILLFHPSVKMCFTLQDQLFCARVEISRPISLHNKTTRCVYARNPTICPHFSNQFKIFYVTMELLFIRGRKRCRKRQNTGKTGKIKSFFQFMWKIIVFLVFSDVYCFREFKVFLKPVFMKCFIFFCNCFF